MQQPIGIRNEQPALYKHHKRALAVVLSLLFLTFLDNTIVSVTLADIQSSLHPGIIELQWVVNGYMLAFAALMLTGGTLGDLFGRKKIMLIGVALFSLGSLVAMLASSTLMLILGRVVMGVGAAASEPGTLSMIRHVYPDRKIRARAVAAWAAVCAIALAMGPVIGGVIISIWTWREVFTLGLILGVLAFIAGALFLPENSDPKGRHLDIPGLLLGATTIASASVAVVQGEAAGYDAWWILALSCLSTLSLFAFILVEKRSKDPVLRLGFFRDPTFAGANVVAFAANFGIFAIFFFTALYLQIMGGFSGFDIALAFLTMAGAMVLASVFTGRWVAKFGPRIPGVLGTFLAAGGMFAVRAVLGPGVTISSLAWAVVIVGAGLGMTIVATNSVVLSIVPSARSGMASSTVNTFRELGGVFGVSVLGAILNARLTSALASRLSSAGVPSGFIGLIIGAVTHGGGRLGKGGAANAPRGYGALVTEAIEAAEAAFGSGLSLALLLTGILLFAAGVVAWFTLRRPAQAGVGADVVLPASSGAEERKIA